MRFFLDECISPKLAEALKILAEFQGYELRHQREKFPAGTKDPVWIPALAAEGDWVIVSGDPRITRGRHEKAAWLESGLTAFFLTDGYSRMQFWKQAAHLIEWWPEIVRLAREATTQRGVEIPIRGSRVREIDIEALRRGRKQGS